MVKIKLPTWKPNLEWYHRWKSKKPTLVQAWRHFVRQIPTESRSLVKSHQHFVVFGCPGAGKSELIHGLVDQSEDLFPFETSHKLEGSVQYFFGPKQVIQEIAFPTLEDRAIKTRRQVIRLWKKLFQFKDPIVVIAQDWTSDSHQNKKEVNRFAQLIAGKLSLLSEITKKPVRVRISLTHLDKIDGYVEFARFLKQQNINFTIPMASEFETNDLERHFKEFFDRHASSMLTLLDPDEYLKVLGFFREVPTLFPEIEEFLRALVTRVRTKGSIALDVLNFTSSLEGSTAFSTFDWQKAPKTDIFFRYPMLKHQVAAACILLGLGSVSMHMYNKDKAYLAQMEEGVELLELYERKAFQEKVLPKLAGMVRRPPEHLVDYLKPRFFAKQQAAVEEELSKQMNIQILQDKFELVMLEKDAELKYIYYLGLIHATNRNKLGKTVLNNLDAYVNATGLSPELIKTYVTLSSHSHPNTIEAVQPKSNPNRALTSLKPWYAFFQDFENLNTQPVFLEHGFQRVKDNIVDLLDPLHRLMSDSLVIKVGSILVEDELGHVCPADIEHIRTVQWVGSCKDNLHKFLCMVLETSVEVPDVHGLNISEFYAKANEIASMAGDDERTFTFRVNSRNFTFNTKHWTDLVVGNNVEKAMQDYVVANTNTGGNIFFNGIPTPDEPAMPELSGLFPVFKTKIAIPGKYSRIEYEKKVRMATERLSHLIGELPVNEEEKNRFNQFLRREVVAYVNKFQDHFIKFYDGCEIETSTLDQIRKTFIGLSKPTAPFYEFIQSVQYHTGAFAQETPCLHSFEELNEFEFLTPLCSVSTHDELLKPYRELMSEILCDLQNGRNGTSKELFPYLAPHLTPASEIGLHILQQTPQSYVNRIRQCLDELGVPQRYQRPFLEPVVELYKYGMKDLTRAIEHLWCSQLYPKVESLLAKFPFNFESDEIASIEEVQRRLHPNRELWSHIRQLISAVCYEDEGEWLALDQNHSQLDQNILVQLRRCSRVTQTLWDDQGAEIPLKLKVKSVPFKQDESSDLTPQLAYLIVDNKTCRSFNQNPNWEEISIEWWNTGSAYIGMDMYNKFTRVIASRDVKHEDEPWSFFQLLKEGKADGSRTWTWQVPNKQGNDPRPMSLCFNQPPQGIFKVLGQN